MQNIFAITFSHTTETLRYSSSAADINGNQKIIYH